MATRQEKQPLPVPRTLAQLTRVVEQAGDGRTRVVEWMDWVAKHIEENCPELVVSGVAILSEQWFKVKECLFILNVDTPGWFEANRRIAEAVLGPALLELGWLPDYYLWTREELQLAREKQHPLWVRAWKEGVTFYGKQLLNGNE